MIDEGEMRDVHKRDLLQRQQRELKNFSDSDSDSDSDNDNE